MAWAFFLQLLCVAAIPNGGQHSIVRVFVAAKNTEKWSNRIGGA